MRIAGSNSNRSVPHQLHDVDFMHTLTTQTLTKCVMQIVPSDAAGDQITPGLPRSPGYKCSRKFAPWARPDDFQ